MDILVSDVTAFKGEPPNAKLGFEPFLSWQAIDVSWPAIAGFGMPDVEFRLILWRAFSDY